MKRKHKNKPGKWGEALIPGRVTDDFIKELYKLSAFDFLALDNIPENVEIRIDSKEPMPDYWIDPKT